MKKGAFLAIFVLISLAGAYAQARMAALNDPNAAVKPGQSEIIINAENADRDIVVWVNNTVVAHVFPKTSERIIVPNGRIVVEAADTTWKGGQWSIGSRKQLALDVNSSSVRIGMATRYGALLSLNVQTNAPLGGGGGVAVAAAPAPSAKAAPAPAPAAAPPPAAAPAPASPGIMQRATNVVTGRNSKAAKSLEEAVQRAAGVLSGLPNGATLAVLSVAAPDTDTSEFVLDELMYLLLETRKFKIVDRKSLDAIRAETKFQSSGEVDDKSAVSLGKMLGASIVITGSISGSGKNRRLRAKALDVKTSEIIEMASEAF